jgi:hypothetical protein
MDEEQEFTEISKCYLETDLSCLATQPPIRHGTMEEAESMKLIIDPAMGLHPFGGDVRGGGYPLGSFQNTTTTAVTQ